MTLERTPLFTALDADYVASGLTPDQHSLLTPLWIEASGVQFVSGKVRRRRASRRITRVDSGPIVGIGQQFLSNADAVYWIIGGRTLWRWDKFSIEQQRTLPDLGQFSPYADIVHYGDWTFINTGVGQPLFHKAAEGFQSMPELPSGFSHLTKFLNYIMAIGTGTKKTGVSWPNSRDIYDWTPQTTNDAGTIYIDQFNSPAKAAINFGQQLVVFSETQVAGVSFIGSPFYFGQRLLFDKLGCVGKEAITTDGAAIYGLCRDGAFAMTLNEYRFIDKDRIQQYFRDNINWGAASQTVVARNDTQRTIDFHLPMRDSPVVNESWSYDPSAGSWTPIKSVRFQANRQVDQFTVAGEQTGELTWLEAGTGGAEPLQLKTRPLLLQGKSISGITETHLDVEISSVELLLHKAENVQMRIGSTNDLSAGFTYTDWIDISVEQQTYLVPAGQPSGSYWQLEFRSLETSVSVTSNTVITTSGGQTVIATDPTTNWDFNLQGFMLFGTLEGTRGAS